MNNKLELDTMVVAW